MLNLLSKLLGGNKSEKDVSKLRPLIAQINGYYQSYQTLTNDELRNKTVEFKERIKTHLTEIDNAIADKNDVAEALPDAQIHQKDSIYHEVDKLKKERNKQIEAILTRLVPEAFAVVKETAHRFSESKTLESKATELDKELVAQDKKHITLKGEQVIYQNQWMAGGNLITWNMVHYDVQLIGGMVLHQGKISEMSTGEGKTLVSTLPAYLNALAGEGVHLVTVNDYLSRRDSEWNAPIFEWLGLRVDCIDKHQPNTANRRNAYMADIVYGTNNEFGFDYLRDNMVNSQDEMVQRGHHFAMVDEVDSVLIDDARTPLIIAGPVSHQDNLEQFFELKPRIEKLVEAQKRAVLEFLNHAKKKIAIGDDNPKDSGLDLYRAYRGLPKNGALIKFLSEPGVRVKLQKAENYYLADQQREMYIVDSELYFYIDEKHNSVELTDKGIQLITRSGEDPNFFILPDISITLAAIDNSADTLEIKLQKKEAIINEYSEKSDRVHTAHQLLKAYTLFEKDVEYVVIDSAVKIVDEQTGRIMEGRRYSDGLHQAIEAKENVQIEATTQTYATVTLQNYFRMYHKLAGMTGTAETEAGELWSIYKLDVVTIPTNVPVVRVDNHDLVYKTKREKYNAVIEEIIKLRTAGRAVLVGTTSVDVSELLSRMLRQKQIEHNVLNAKQHAREAQIIAEAGLPTKVTIATNMAGRGTDIKLQPSVKDAGGLAILGTERHESRRVDRQLRGRAGRQGDPGSSQFFVSLDDNLMRMFGSERIAKVMDFAGYKEGDVIQHSMITRSIERAQKKVEENHFGTRKRLLEYDDVMNKQRKVIYTKRNHALLGDRLSLDLDNAFYAVAESTVVEYKEEDSFEGFQLAVLLHFAVQTNITEEQFRTNQIQQLAQTLYDEVIIHYQQKKKYIAEEAIPMLKNIHKQQANFENVILDFSNGKKNIRTYTNLKKTLETNGEELLSALERSITLNMIDDTWKEHLRAMDDLKQSVQTATYEQKDPLVIYKVEAFNLFKTMDAELNKDIVSFLCHVNNPFDTNLKLQEGKQARTDLSNIQTHKDDIDGNVSSSETTVSQPKTEPVKAAPKIGRNDTCPCGSGKKFKNCHGRQ